MHELKLARALVRRHEGLRLNVYDDATGFPIRAGSLVGGHPTIGVGRNLESTGVSEVEAEMMLTNDLIRASIGASTWLGPSVWRDLNTARRAAVIDFVLNVGLGTALEFKRTREAIACSNWQLAHDRILESRYAEQVGDRAKRIASILLTGKIDDIANDAEEPLIS